jgi:hypothetical protein
VGTIKKNKTNKMSKIDYYEAYEIACEILGVEPDEDENTEKCEELLSEKWGISLEAFHEIMICVFKMTKFGMSPLTQTPYIGIAKSDMWLVKKEVTQEFIAALIEWCTEGEKIPKGKKGFVRTITKGGKHEYDITITRPIN